MAASDAIPVPRKNAAFRFYFAIRRPSDSTLITTWAGQDSEVSLDGAAYADCTNEATEIGTSGTGYIDLTASEMNADAVVLKVTVTNTGAVPLVFVLYPEEAGDYRADPAATRSALGLDSANLDTQLADLPTVAEFNARTLVAADYLVVGDMPANFAGLGINASGHVERVVLVDTTTTNSDMRGTDGANTATPLDAAGTRAAVGLASANLDTQLSTIDTVVDGITTEVGKIPRAASALAAGSFTVEVVNGQVISGGQSVDMEYK
jgi:hypothetical protein